MRTDLRRRMTYALNCRLRFSWLKIIKHKDEQWMRSVGAFKQAHKKLGRKDSVLLSVQDQRIANDVREQTTQANVNNLTRTQAYLEIFRACPEIHWALLAHAVSRNGGYGMTDLKGEFFPRLASSKQQEDFFAMLERANWLIFQDAYPQLLLYQAGRRLGRNLHHLLTHFHVSTFMTAVWEMFWRNGDSRWLTIALIVNEQHYIEERVVQDPYFQKNVLGTVQFQSQSLLNLTEVCIPYHMGGETRLNGTVVGDFTSLNDRIETGKKLYNILFGEHKAKHQMHRWLQSVHHTGSRADYWPDVFFRGEPHLAQSYAARFGPDGKQLGKLASPKLLSVWPNSVQEPPDTWDWYQHLTQLCYMWSNTSFDQVDVSSDVVNRLQTMDALVWAKSSLGSFVEQGKTKDS